MSTIIMGNLNLNVDHFSLTEHSQRECANTTDIRTDHDCTGLNKRWEKILAGEAARIQSLAIVCDAIWCDEAACDAICSNVCDTVCDQICASVCDGICDQICDQVCDTWSRIA